MSGQQSKNFNRRKSLSKQTVKPQHSKNVEALNSVKSTNIGTSGASDLFTIKPDASGGGQQFNIAQ